jgi:hypothetical protein
VWHEFGHALGLDHEMQHPESDIAWNVTRLYEGYGYKNKNYVDAQILEKMKDTNLKTSYDSFSIMHYPVPAHDTLDGRVVKENFKISRLDKELIRNVYRIKPPRKIDESAICHPLSETAFVGRFAQDHNQAGSELSGLKSQAPGLPPLRR